jgi:hypothetical protein
MPSRCGAGMTSTLPFIAQLYKVMIRKIKNHAYEYGNYLNSTMAIKLKKKRAILVPS